MNGARKSAVTFGEFRLDLTTESVWRDADEIRVRPKTFALLRYLAEHPRRLVTKEELLAAVWPEVAVGEGALAVCVGEIRRALGDDPRTPRFIETVHRRGYRFIGSATPGTRTAAADAPLVGRDPEMSRLNQAVDEARRCCGQVVVIRGEAGIGKSRVVEELAVEAEARGGRVLLGRCYETEQILPFGPWVHAIRTAGILTETNVVSELPRPWQLQLARLFPELGDAAPPDDLAQNVRLFEAVAHLVEHLSRPQPIVLALEDLHWADEMSVRLVGFLARQIRTWPVLLVVTAREEELPGPPVLGGLLHELARDDRALQVSLAPLSRAETATLVRALARTCGDEPSLARLAEQLWSVSEGNPFLVVETMRVVGEGATHATTSRLPVPERVRELIIGRLARLSACAQHLAAVASVIGRDFDFALLARAAGLEEGRAADGVEELTRRRVLVGTGERFDFTHDRIREVAYAQLLPPRRRLLHAHVATALEAIYHGALEPYTAALAAHYCRGEVWNKALTYLREAGARAVACSANREAITHFDQALEVLRHLPEGRSKTAHAYDFRMLRASAHYSLGELRRIVDDLDETEALARDLDDRTRLGRVAVLRLACLSPMGDQAGAIEAGERGLAAAEAAGNVPRQAVATVILGFAHMARGDFSRAIELLRTSARLLEGQPAHERFGQIGLPAVFWRTWLIFSLGELGAFREAIAHGEQAVRIADAADQPFSMAEAHGALGHLYSLKGEPTLGIPSLERSVALCRSYQIVLLSPLMMAGLGAAYAAAGRVREAISTLEEAVNRGKAHDLMWWQSRRTAQLGEAYLLAGRVDDGRDAAAEALDLAEAHSERPNCAYAQRLLGDVACGDTRGDLATGEHHLSRALTLAEELKMSPLAARCHRDLRILYRRIGNRERAAWHHATATAMYREMDMREQGGDP